MAQQERLLRNYMAALLTVLCSCNTNTPQTTLAIVSQSLNRNITATNFDNGILIVNKKPFSGTLYTLFAGTTDTAELTCYIDGKENGQWKKYYPSKKIREVRFFDRGQKVGQYIAWWENGKKELQYNFYADEYEGECREWNESGFLVKIMHYKKGHEEGAQQWWYDNGKYKANYIIKNGRRYGLLGTKNCTNASERIFKN